MEHFCSADFYRRVEQNRGECHEDEELGILHREGDGESEGKPHFIEVVGDDVLTFGRGGGEGIEGSFEVNDDEEQIDGKKGGQSRGGLAQENHDTTEQKDFNGKDQAVYPLADSFGLSLDDKGGNPGVEVVGAIPELVQQNAAQPDEKGMGSGESSEDEGVAGWVGGLAEDSGGDEQGGDEVRSGSITEDAPDTPFFEAQGRDGVEGGEQVVGGEESEGNGAEVGEEGERKILGEIGERMR